jgi:hypothetical protein
MMMDQRQIVMMVVFLGQKKIGWILSDSAQTVTEILLVLTREREKEEEEFWWAFLVLGL